MKIRSPVWILFVIILGADLTWPIFAASNDTVDPVATKKELKQLQKRINGLQHQIKRKQSQHSKAEQSLRKTEKNISQIKSSLRQANKHLSKTERTLSRLNQTQAILLKAKDDQKSALVKDISTSYQASRQEYLKMVLNQEQPDHLARQLKYYEYFHKARMKRIIAFNETLRELNENQINIRQEKTEQEQLKVDLQQQEAKLKKASQQRKVVLSELNSDLQNQSSQIKVLKKDQHELEAVLSAVQESLADLPSNMGGNPFSEQKGKLLWPTRGKIVTVFGQKKQRAGLRWNGNVISATEGSDVKAVHPGRIVFSDWMRGYGNIIIIDHGNGFLSLYGHNESLLKSPGDWVGNREIIAYVGNSGGQKRSGLYFEIRKRGIPIDPAGWCKKP